MWQAPSQKLRGAAARKPNRGAGRASLQIKRVTAEIRSSNDAVDVVSVPATQEKTPAKSNGVEPLCGSVRILLNELTARGVGAYCNRPFVAGQEIIIMIAVPSPTYIRGRVTYCMEQESKTAVISATPFYYRLGIRFIFENATEEAAVNKYCEDIAKALRAA